MSNKSNRPNSIVQVVLHELPDLEDAIGQMAQGNLSERAIVDAVTPLLDELLSWPVILSPLPFLLPLAPFLEMGDGPVLRIVTKAIVRAVLAKIKKVS